MVSALESVKARLRPAVHRLVHQRRASLEHFVQSIVATTTALSYQSQRASEVRSLQDALSRGQQGNIRFPLSDLARGGWLATLSQTQEDICVMRARLEDARSKMLTDAFTSSTVAPDPPSLAVLDAEGARLGFKFVPAGVYM